MKNSKRNIGILGTLALVAGCSGSQPVPENMKPQSRYEPVFKATENLYQGVDAELKKIDDYYDSQAKQLKEQMKILNSYDFKRYDK